MRSTTSANDPDLANRPLRFSSQHLDEVRLLELCRRGTVQVISRADMQKVGFVLNSPVSSPRFEALTASLNGQPCLRPHQ
jgi:hypothetical protein